MYNLIHRIQKLLSRVHNECTITLDSKHLLNEFANKLTIYLIANLYNTNDLKALLPDEIYRYAIKECKEDSKYYGKNALAIDSSTIKKLSTYYDLEIKCSSEFVACVVEYIMCEVLEVSGVYTRNKQKVKIKPEFIHKAIDEDKELSILFKNINNLKNIPRRSRKRPRTRHSRSRRARKRPRHSRSRRTRSRYIRSRTRSRTRRRYSNVKSRIHTLSRR